MKTIEVVVAADGSLAIDALGFQGPDCEKATRFLEEALGRPGERRRKPEYATRARVKGRQKVGQ
jgi:hypothetical protein